MTATVVIPTLVAGEALAECLGSLARQTCRDFDVIVVDNSGRGLACGMTAQVIANDRNVGFGAAVNQGWQRSPAPFVATLNDDAVAHPGWLGALLDAAQADARIGMCASQVRLAGTGRLDSAGMVIARDGSSKQRGHGEDPCSRSWPQEALCPSGSAALYRRAMLEETGGFEPSFFLYCEDTDLGLRARWWGWRCVYASEAIVEHRYSHSAGRASNVKAYLVERNRLWTIVRNYPLLALVAALPASVVRYAWHVWFSLRGKGVAAEHGNALLLAWFVAKAHGATLVHMVELLRARRRIRRHARLRPGEFAAMLAAHSISLKQVAAL